MLGTLGTIQFTEIGPAIAAGHFAMGDAALTAIALLLFVGATGKSAQIPLYVWLPDAMEGPTPVSALIHAATMVTAGVYMIARTNAVFSMAPKALAVVAVVGCVTAIFAATMGLVQNDIKRVLAYSTVSQLGYMFLACGVGAFTAGVFHLMTHAFFKALLFLGSGSVIHAHVRRAGHAQDGRAVEQDSDDGEDVSSWHRSPSREFRRWPASSARTRSWATRLSTAQLLWLIGFITAGMTAFYMFRLVNMTFFGESRVDHEVEHHIHESPSSMTVPLMILAVLSMVGGWIGWPESLGGSDRFAQFLEPVMAKHAEVGAAAAAQAASGASMEYVLMAGVGARGAAAASGWRTAGTSSSPEVPGQDRSVESVSVPLALQQVLRGPDLRRDVRESREGSGAHAGRVRRRILSTAWAWTAPAG